MSSSSRSRVAYIETNDAGKPCQTLAHLSADVAGQARLHRLSENYVGVSGRDGTGRRRVKITITVEDLNGN